MENHDIIDMGYDSVEDVYYVPGYYFTRRLNTPSSYVRA